jgi:hypothetical protein
MELERTITRRMSVDPATLHPSRPVLSADEMTGQDEEVDMEPGAEAAISGGMGMRRFSGSSSALNGACVRRMRRAAGPRARGAARMPARRCAQRALRPLPAARG